MIFSGKRMLRSCRSNGLKIFGKLWEIEKRLLAENKMTKVLIGITRDETTKLNSLPFSSEK